MLEKQYIIPLNSIKQLIADRSDVLKACMIDVLCDLMSIMMSVVIAESCSDAGRASDRTAGVCNIRSTCSVVVWMYCILFASWLVITRSGMCT